MYVRLSAVPLSHIPSPGLHFFPFSFFFLVFVMGAHDIAEAGLYLPSAGIIAVYHQAQLSLLYEGF
jgi:hypothetical protein